MFLNMVRFLVALAVFPTFFISQASAQFYPDPSSPLVLEGYVTREVSPSDFDVNGIHIQSNEKTAFGKTAQPDRRIVEGGRSNLWIGEPVSIYGKMNKRTQSIAATGIVFHLQEPHKLSGDAIIDSILSPLKSGEVLVRADGYPIRIDQNTKIKFTEPLTSLSSVAPNVWIAFHGSLHPDGIVVAESVELSPNRLFYGEDKLLRKTNYDPSAVPDDTGQDELKKLAFGLDPKKIPPYHDAAMQARIEHIGNSLIPKYQRALPKSDETKILFQFQLIDHPEWRYALALPSGVILVPRRVVELLQDDSQLAALLADGVSCALEKQLYRELSSDGRLLSTIASGIAGWGSLGTAAYWNYGRNIYGGNSPTARQHQEQRDRVALSLMRDAGYDLMEAPKAWWLLSAKDPKNFEDSAMPNRAIYLYRTIGAVSHDDSKMAISSTTTAANQ
jgi:hypothetical protein